MYFEAEDCASAKEEKVFRYARAGSRRDCDQRRDLRRRISRRPVARLPIQLRAETKVRICKRRHRRRKECEFREFCARPEVIGKCKSIVRSAGKRIRGGSAAQRVAADRRHVVESGIRIAVCLDYRQSLERDGEVG